MAAKARSTGAKRTRSERASVGTDEKHRPFAEVFGDLITAVVEYSKHPERPEATRDLMLLLMESIRKDLAEAIEKRDRARRQQSL